MSKNEYLLRDYRRARSLARVLHMRVYRTQTGAVHCVSGLPRFDRLHFSLTRSNGAFYEAAQMGYAVASEGSLTPDVLARCNKALLDWQRFIRDTSRKSVRGKNRDRELREIDYLQRRLRWMYRWSRGCVGSQTANQNHIELLLDDEQSQLLEAQLLRLLGRRAARVRAIATFVLWSRGAEALSKFLRAAVTCYKSNGATLLAETVLRKIACWKIRSEYEPRQTLQQEMQKELSELPHSFRSECGLSARPRNRTMAAHCGLIESRVSKWMAKQSECGSESEAGFAALVVCDRRDSPLPTNLVDYLQTNRKFDDLRRCMNVLGRELGQAGYAKLVSLVDSNPSAYHIHQFRSIRKMLSQGVTKEDLLWLRNQSIYYFPSDTVYSPSWLRRTVTVLEKYGIEGCVERLLESVNKCGEAQVVDQFCNWLVLLDPRATTPKEVNELKVLFFDWILPNTQRKPGRDVITQWAAVPRETEALLTLPTPESQRFANAYTAYARVLGEPERLPKSVRREIPDADRCRSEIRYLEELQGRAEWLPKHETRLYSLRRRLEKTGPDSCKRLNRAAQSAYLLKACDALKQMIRTEAQQRCHDLAGLTGIPRQQLFDTTTWLEQLSGKDKKTLNEIVGAVRETGQLYRMHLKKNGFWILEARSKGIDLLRWNAPSSCELRIEDQKLCIEASWHPAETVLMGSYVNTCLSLPDGCNVHNVLPNAYDANKQVLYVRNHRGAVLARKLVAISADFGLIGYELYKNYSETESRELDRCIVRATEQFCGRWAFTIGVPLKDDGVPQHILNEDWYDDEAEAWTSAAHQAWERRALSGEPVVDAHASQPVPSPALEPSQLSWTVVADESLSMA